MKLILFIVKRSFGVFLLAVLTALIGGGVNTLLLGILHRTLSQAQDHPEKVIVWAFFAICLVVPLARATSEIMLVRLGQKSVLELRLELSRRILGISLRRLEEIRVPRILSTLTEDISVLANSMTLIPNVCFNLSIVITCFAYLIYLSLTAFTALLILLVIGILCYQIPIFKANRFFSALRETNDDLYHHFQALTQGMKELKLHRERRLAFLTGPLERTARKFERESVTGLSIYTIASSWAQAMAFVIIGLAVFVLPDFVSAFTPQLVMGYTLVFIYLITPLQTIMNSLPNLNRAAVSIGRIDKLGLGLETAELTSTVENLLPAASPWEHITFRGATHSYRQDTDGPTFTLGPLDLTLYNGDLTFIIGGNGSGKTTLAKLMTGLYVPEKGAIEIDGKEIVEENLESYRSLFTAVFSDFFLFEEFLGIEFTNLHDNAQRYLAQLQLDKKVEIKERTLSTTDLSQGQRKRLALLTAYVEDRPIYLFDEWAADQDPSFKEVFYHTLLPELKSRGKTIVVISHDDSYYHVADRIIKLNYGQIESDERPHSA